MTGARVVAVTDAKRGVAVAIVDHDGVRFVVFFAVRDTAWQPLEARWTSGGEVSEKAARREMRAWTEPTAGLPLRASDIRRFRLGEALAALPTTRHPVEELSRSAVTVDGQETHLIQLRDMESAVRQVRAAAAYERIARSSARPVQDTARALGLSPGQVRGLLSKARQRGYLTSPGEGSTGGQVTDKARRIVEADTTSSASRQTFIDTGAYLPTGAAGTDETWNTSPSESPDLTCVIDPSDLAALTDALEEHDATCELELSIARLEARKRIGAGE